MGIFRGNRDWYRNAVFYSLDVKTYKDSNGDGIGDFQGLISRLGHISSLGVDCIWLLPFFPSPLRDNGYDVSDYYDVDPRLGTLDDLTEFVERARHLGMKVLIDLVINHTSDQHPWFKDARTSVDARYRHYYVWHKTPDHNEVKVDFDHAEDSVWEYTPETDMYYLHRFYKEQPDLNLSHPEVQDEILRIMDFWIGKGICSYRIDAAHMITDPVEIENTDHEEMHKLFSKMRRNLEQQIDHGILLAEANVEPEKLTHYFGDGENGDARMHLLFNFIANKYTMLAFARKDAAPMRKGLELFSRIDDGHWINFIRHHDELNTDMLSDEERDELFAAFAPEENMRALDGIRRRLPPMLGNDRRRIELMFKVVFGLPGIPLINYGEEIGMGDDLSLKGRFAVRTPMQWDTSANAGFSTAARDLLHVPVIDKGAYGYQHVNVEQQEKDPGSLLHFVRSMVRLRKAHPVIGQGNWHIIGASDERIMALLYKGDENLLVVHNLSDQDVKVALDMEFTHIEEAVYWDHHDGPLSLASLQMKAYGSRWLMVK